MLALFLGTCGEGGEMKFAEVTHAEGSLPRAVASEPCATTWAAESSPTRLGIVPEDSRMLLGVGTL